MDLEPIRSLLDDDLSLSEAENFNYLTDCQETVSLINFDLGSLFMSDNHEYKQSINYYQLFWKDKLKLDHLNQQWKNEIRQMNLLRSAI
jgi:hypothetical protein